MIFGDSYVFFYREIQWALPSIPDPSPGKMLWNILNLSVDDPLVNSEKLGGKKA